MVEVNSWLTGKRGVCVPFADFCGPIARREERGERRGVLNSELRTPNSELLLAAIDLGSRRGWNYVEWRGGFHPDEEVACVGGSKAEPSIRLLSHTVDLRCGEEELFCRLDGSSRRGVRKAEKAGVKIEFRTDLESMREYYRLHCLTRRNKHGLPPQPWRFFEKIQEHLIARGMGFVALATAPGGRGGDGRSEIGDRARNALSHPAPSFQLPASGEGGLAIAGAVFLRYGRTAFYKFGASDDAYLDLRPNNLLMWRSILRCMGLGCETLGLGRTNLGEEGLRRFKRGWGATESEHAYCKLDPRSDRWLRERNLRHGGHNRFFRALPLWANRLAGELLYPHLD
jgi:hypothetical protein